MLVVRLFPQAPGGCQWLMTDGAFCPDKKRAARFPDLWRVMHAVGTGKRYSMGDVFERLPSGRTLIVENDYPETCDEPHVVARLEKY